MFTFFPPNSKSELLLHSLSPHSKPGRRTATCRNRHGTYDYLLSLGLGLTEAFPLVAICHFWWLVKSGHVSFRRLRSHKWLKRFFLERSATGHFFQTAFLAASCPASNSNAGRLGGPQFRTVMAPKLQRPLLGIFAWNLAVLHAKQMHHEKCFVSLCAVWNGLRAQQNGKPCSGRRYCETILVTVT